MPERKHIFILGGTTLARGLAETLIQQGHMVTTALAGRTENPHLPAGNVQIGGLGGTHGLVGLLRSQSVDLLIDATHPFAAKISQIAFEAAQMTNTRLARLQSHPWQFSSYSWQDCASYEAAATVLPTKSNALLTIGRQNLHAFLARTDCTFLARMIEKPDITLPENFTTLFARPPFSIAQEQTLLRDHNITHLILKNAGGTTTSTKLDAANSLGIKILMIARPSLPKVDSFTTSQELINQLLP